VVAEFKRRVNTEVRQQEQLKMAEEKGLWKRGVVRKIYGKNIIWME